MEFVIDIHHPLIPVWTIFLFFLGLCIGSFLNVCIWRLPRDESISFPPSHCPKCDHELSWYENIPLISWLCLKGKCRNCKNSITIRYFMVELLTGILFMGVWFKVLSFELNQTLFIAVLISYLVVTILAILAAFIDFEHFIIPNKITYPTLVYGLIAAPLFPQLWHGDSRWLAFVASCASVTVCGGCVWFMAYIGKLMFKKDALGWGDIKYIVALSAVLGPIASFFTLLVASIIGAVAGLILIACKKRSLKSPLPFGVCLAIATYLWILVGMESVQLYLRICAEFRG